MNVFFFLFTLSLFLPTDVVGVPEFFWAVALIYIGIRHGRMVTNATQINRSFIILWICSLCMLILGFTQSSSPAASLLTLVKYIEGFMAFLLGVLWAKQELTWISIMTRYGLLAIACFLILVGIPSLNALIPSYNSLIAINGHHPIAAFTLFLLPFVIHSKRTDIVSNIKQFVVLIGLLFSAARLAWGIAILYFITYIFTARPRVLISFFVGILALSLSTTLVLSILPTEQKSSLIHTLPFIQIYTKDINESQRNELMHQTMQAIQSSPVHGFGPGTFFLISRQFQSAPGQFARFAHSFPLETLAENGIAQSIPIILLFIFVIISAYQALMSKTTPKALPIALILLFVYGCVDTPLNMYPLWILFWVCAGIIHHTSPSKSLSPRPIARGALGLLSLFCLSYISSTMIELHGNTSLSFRIAPYRASFAMNNVDSLRRTDNPSINFWYMKDPAFLAAQKTKTALLQAHVYEPYNYRYLQAILTDAVTSNDTHMLSAFICTPFRVITDSQRPCTANIDSTVSILLQHKTETLNALTYLQGNDGLSKTLYFLGLTLYNTRADTEGAIRLLELARDGAPDWGYYHVALASAHYNWKKDIQASLGVLQNCRNHPVAFIGCTILDPDLLSPPEGYASDIARIPEIQ